MDINPLHIGDWLLNVGVRFPDLLALFVGSLIGYVFTAMMELYFLPLTNNPVEKRRQQRLTFVICWMAAGAASAILWAFLDPSDKPAMRISISYLVAVLAFAGYPFLAKLGTGVFPRIGSAWRKPKDPPDTKEIPP